MPSHLRALVLLGCTALSVAVASAGCNSSSGPISPTPSTPPSTTSSPDPTPDPTPTPAPSPAPTPTPAPAPVATVSLSGFVRNAGVTGPVENALVEVKAGPNAGRGVRTDADGAFRLHGLTPGTTRFEVSATGFSSDGATLDMAADTVFTFQLRPAS